jgi:LytS/YehU family sensor histidine kinase
VVNITAAVSTGRLDVMVTNTGRLRPPSLGNGRGLDNVRERLRLIYGNAAAFSLEERHGTVEARLSMPAIPA